MLGAWLYINTSVVHHRDLQFLLSPTEGDHVTLLGSVQTRQDVWICLCVCVHMCVSVCVRVYVFVCALACLYVLI